MLLKDIIVLYLHMDKQEVENHIQCLDLIL